MKNTVVIIPARMGSSRFPGKPLFPIYGKPMIQYCIENAEDAFGRDNTYVATCDDIIFNFVESIGSNAVMTSHKHDRASDRTAEAVNKIESSSGVKYDIVAMLQGDEPLIIPKMITDACQPLLDDPDVKVSNMMAKITSIEEFNDPNEVKVTVDINNNALYFSREPIPSLWKLPQEAVMLKQVCIIPFRRDFIDIFNALPETPIERLESVDMMRVLEHGMNVKMIFTEQTIYSVDTPEDATRVENYLKDNA
jgi:3-deoxy-manno-octulosonate cytidylyltransferase (CMP-KDO synthetase)